MENSNIKADYVWYIDEIFEYDEYSKFENISDLIHYNLPPNITRNIKYNFGDLVAFSDYRDTGTYIIGKDGKLIANPDYSAAGYLTIPYEITQYLDNAVEKYSDIEVNYIDLRFDDKFILDKINTKSSIILEKWNWKLTLIDDNYLSVKFPNGVVQEFDVNSTSTYKIKKWYDASKKEQTIIKVYYEINGESYDKFLKKYGKDNYKWLSAIPNVPSTWTINHGSSGGGNKNHFSNYTFKGPKSEEDKVIENIKKFYNGFNHTITNI